MRLKHQQCRLVSVHHVGGRRRNQKTPPSKRRLANGCLWLACPRKIERANFHHYLQPTWWKRRDVSELAVASVRRYSIRNSGWISLRPESRRSVRREHRWPGIYEFEQVRCRHAGRHSFGVHYLRQRSLSYKQGRCVLAKSTCVCH